MEEIKRGGWRRDREKPEKREEMEGKEEGKERRTRQRIVVDDDNVRP